MVVFSSPPTPYRGFPGTSQPWPVVYEVKDTIECEDRGPEQGRRPPRPAAPHLRRQTSMQIFVNTFIDQQLTLDVEATDTIADVKAKIQDMMRLPVARQRLIFADAVMQDDKTLADV